MVTLVSSHPPSNLFMNPLPCGLGRDHRVVNARRCRTSKSAKPAAQAVVECVNVFCSVKFAGLINRLREGVGGIQSHAVTGTLPHRSRETVVTAALAVLSVVDRSEARRQSGEVPTVLDQVSSEPVDVVVGIQVPAYRTDVVNFRNGRSW